jgi:hypothetical protein
MDMGISEDMIIPIIILFVIVIAASFIMGKIYGSKPKQQPLAKNQYERMINDLTVSCKNNRIRNTKHISFTGDSTHPALPKYARYLGSVADARMFVIMWRVRWFTPKRLSPVDWSLVSNIGGKELFIDGNGFEKTGYFMKDIITREHIKAGKDIHTYDNDFYEFIRVKLNEQGILDGAEQGQYEIMVAMSHKERSVDSLLTKREYPEIEESYREPEQELEG